MKPEPPLENAKFAYRLGLSPGSVGLRSRAIELCFSHTLGVECRRRVGRDPELRLFRRILRSRRDTSAPAFFSICWLLSPRGRNMRFYFVLNVAAALDFHLQPLGLAVASALCPLPPLAGHRRPLRLRLAWFSTRFFPVAFGYEYYSVQAQHSSSSSSSSTAAAAAAAAAFRKMELVLIC